MLPKFEEPISKDCYASFFAPKPYIRSALDLIWNLTSLICLRANFHWLVNLNKAVFLLFCCLYQLSFANSKMLWQVWSTFACSSLTAFGFGRSEKCQRALFISWQFLRIQHSGASSLRLSFVCLFGDHLREEFLLVLMCSVVCCQ